MASVCGRGNGRVFGKWLGKEIERGPSKQTEKPQEISTIVMHVAKGKQKRTRRRRRFV